MLSKNMVLAVFINSPGSHEITIIIIILLWILYYDNIIMVLHLNVPVIDIH